MADSLLEENKKTEDEILDEEIDRTLLCGWFSWRPNFLQKFASPKFFLFLYSIFTISQGMLVMGVTSIALPDIEKEFGLSSKQSAIILLSNDIAGMLLLPAISFIGQNGNKPKWIGTGAVITGIGALIMCMPKLIIGDYKVPGSYLTKSTLCSSSIYHTSKQGGSDFSCSGNTGFGSSTKFLAIFSLAQLVMGIGTTPAIPLGSAYLDENLDPKVLPIYYGILFISNFFGQGLGFLFGGSFLKIFTNLKLPKGMILSRTDPRWIGAWWLPFLILVFPTFLSGFLLLCFPKEMPKYRRKRKQAMNDGELPAENKKIGTGFKDLWKATLDLLKNKMYILSTFALTVKIIFVASISGYISKIIVLKFGGSFHEVAGYISASSIPGSGVGILLGSLVMRCISVKDAAKKATMIIAISTALCCFSSAIWLVPGCNTTNLAGAAIPSSNSSMKDPISNQCNAQCGCSRRSYQPVCGEDGITYFSPCFAGCKAKSSGGYENCSCITTSKASYQYNSQTKMNNSEFSNSKTTNKSIKAGFFKAFNGRCDRNCKNLVIFLFIASISGAMSFFSAIPQKIMTIRCVPDNQRSYALGFQLLIMRTFSFIPGPLIVGTIIDANCLVWGIDRCGNRGSCLDYYVDKLSKHFFFTALAANGVSTLLYFLAWFFYVPAETNFIEENRNQEIGLLQKNEKNNKEDGSIKV